MACKFIPLKGFPEAIIEIETTPDIALPPDPQEQEIIEPPSSETVTDVQSYAESADAAEQNRLNEKQAQGMLNNDILSKCVLLKN